MNVITASNLRALAPSAAWMQSLKASLAAFAPTGSPLTAGLLDDNWAGPQIAHPIYSVGLAAIADPNLLAGLEKIFCWRFMAADAVGSPTATGCWATPEIPGVPAKIVAAIRGPEAADALTSTERLNHLNIVTGQPNNTYDIRVLRVPGLCMEVFWLKYTGVAPMAGASGDWLVPYGLVISGADTIKLPGGATLNKNQAYTADDFLKIAGVAARNRLAAEQLLATRVGA